MKQKTTINFADVACFVIPALSFLRFRLVGMFYVTDAFLLVALFFLLARRRGSIQDPQIRQFVKLGLVWLAAQIITDVIRGTPFVDYARGWSKIALTITHLLAIALLIRQSRKRLVLYGVGWGVGGVLMTFLAPTEYVLVAPWKFGLGIPVTLFVCLLASQLARRYAGAAAVLILAMAAVHIYADFRSLGLVCAVAAVYSYLHMTPSLTFRERRKRRMITVMANVVLALCGTSFLYIYVAESGWLGPAALARYQQQSEGAGGIAVGGRSYLLSGFTAIADSPVIGHGSWAIDPKYNSILKADLLELGYRNGDSANPAAPIPVHSYLLGAWVDSGLLGIAFWGWALITAGRAMLGASSREPLLPFFAMIVALLVWNILFSPYGADQRFTATYSIYVAILIRRFGVTQRGPCFCVPKASQSCRAIPTYDYAKRYGGI